MNDPHVKSLTYILVVLDRNKRFDNPPAQIHDANTYTMCLKDGALIVTLKEHFSSVDSARAHVEPALKSWELHAALENGREWIRFVFDPDRIELIDLRPGPLKSGDVLVSATALVGNATLTDVSESIVVNTKTYPKPPDRFKSSPELLQLFQRFELTLFYAQSELMSVGYAILTYLESLPKDNTSRSTRDNAAKLLRVEVEVLRKFGELVSTRGNATNGRKLKSNAPLEPLKPTEANWIRQAILAMLRRKGEYDHSPASVHDLPLISMADLPNLSANT